MGVTFEDLRREAYRLLGDAEDALRDARKPDVECTNKQHQAIYIARHRIAAAKDALNDAA